MVILIRLTHLWCPTILREITLRINTPPPPLFFNHPQNHPRCCGTVGFTSVNLVYQISVNEKFGDNLDEFILAFSEKKSPRRIIGIEIGEITFFLCSNPVNRVFPYRFLDEIFHEVVNLIVHITNEWQTNLSLISRECREAGNLLGARLKLSFLRKKARKLKWCRAGRIGSGFISYTCWLCVRSRQTCTRD